MGTGSGGLALSHCQRGRETQREIAIYIIYSAINSVLYRRANFVTSSCLCKCKYVIEIEIGIGIGGILVLCGKIYYFSMEIISAFHNPKSIAKKKRKRKRMEKSPRKEMEVEIEM